MHLKATLTDGSIRAATEIKGLEFWIKEGLLTEDTVVHDEENGATMRAGDMNVIQNALREKRTRGSDRLLSSRPPIPDEKKCPYCAETIKVDAVICRFCNRDLVTNGDDPLAHQKVDNGVFWTMAFLPLVGLFLQQVIAGSSGSKTNDLWWVSILLNCLFIAIDLDKVKKAGFKTDSLAAAGLLLFPVYMFMRGERTKAGPAAGLVWIAFFVISILWGIAIAAGEALRGMPGLGR